MLQQWVARGRCIGPSTRPAVMGIINATPDSFSDGGQFRSTATLIDHAAKLVEGGADLLDLGGESTRPGALPVSLQEELDRVMPALVQITARFDCPVSIDTSKPEVARAAVNGQAAIINDVTGFDNPAMVDVAQATDVGVVVMHMQGTPQFMQQQPLYREVVGDVFDYLTQQVARLRLAGIACDRIAIDPGIGFGKTFEHNLALLRRLGEFARIGAPVLVGTSRKGFLGQMTGRAIADRQSASVASALAAATRGARIVRVHDVQMTVDALKVWESLIGWA